MTHADTLRMLASLAAIVALIFALAWIARRTGWLRGHASPAMQLLGTQRLGQTRASLVLVQIEDVRLVLGVTAAQVTLLHTLTAHDRQTDTPPAPPQQQDATFHTILQAQQAS